MKWRTRLAYRLLSPRTWDAIKSDWALSRRRLRNSHRNADLTLLKTRHYRIHLGCGLRVATGWINIDAIDHEGVDLRWDVRDSLPYPSEIASLVYSEHLLEHLEYEDAIGALKQVFRVLSPGGRLRLGVPDAERYMNAYVANDRQFFCAMKRIGNPVSPLDTPIKVINQMFRMGGAHRYAWDFTTLSQELATLGFAAIARWPSGQSSKLELCLDDPSHAEETLYVEAEKPTRHFRPASISDSGPA